MLHQILGADGQVGAALCQPDGPRRRGSGCECGGRGSGQYSLCISVSDDAWCVQWVFDEPKPPMMRTAGLSALEAPEAFLSAIAIALVLVCSDFRT